VIAIMTHPAVHQCSCYCADRERARCKALEDALADMVLQFAYDNDGTPPTIHTGGLSALEGAFAALGWPDPKPVPERQCDEPGCPGVATCGWPSDTAYRRTCGAHWRKQP
jgi:hypothetical protein